MKKILQLSFVMLFLTNSVLTQGQKDQLEEKISCEKIDIGCLILGRETRGEHIIKNDIEYQQLIQSRSTHSNCSDYQLPEIDFNKYTLIGYVSSIAGCDLPKISYEIIKQNNQYSINLTVIQHGMCERNNPIKTWCLIPRVEESSVIKFNIEKN